MYVEMRDLIESFDDQRFFFLVMSINFTAFNVLMPLYGRCSTWVDFTQAK